MNCLIIFDSSVDPYAIENMPLKSGECVFLFPLTSFDRLVREVADAVISKMGKGAVEIIQTACVVNDAAERVREAYIKFIADLSVHKIQKGRNLRETFAIDNETSLWWFSLVAEKNTVKTDSFLRMAQLDAVDQTVKNKNIDRIFVGCQSGKLINALRSYAITKNIVCRTLKTKKKSDIGSCIRTSKKMLYVKHLIQLIMYASSFFLRTWKIRRRLSKLKRNPLDDDCIMIITYYPSFDLPSAEQGLFKNKHYPGIREALEAKNKNVVWVCLSVENNAISFDKSIFYAELFIEKGERIYFIEEFISYLSILKAIMIVLRGGIIFKTLEKDIASFHTFEDYNIYDLFEDDWYSSFVGYTGFSGTVYYLGFRDLLLRGMTKRVLYCCEMHAWEKALISARNATKKNVQLFAYQHAAIPRMLLNYFNDPSEIKCEALFPLPKPDKVICNGMVTYQYLRDCQWPEAKLSVAEAIRFSYLSDRVRQSVTREKDTVLIILSINAGSSNALLQMCCSAMEDIKGLEVWIKPHPFADKDDIGAFLEKTARRDNYIIKMEPVEKLLRNVAIVVVDESSIALEALAFGCAVVTVNMSETLNMSPLRNVKAHMIRTVNSVGELKETVNGLLKNRTYDSEDGQREAGEIVKQYFHLHNHLESPERLLDILENGI